ALAPVARRRRRPPEAGREPAPFPTAPASPPGASPPAAASLATTSLATASSACPGGLGAGPASVTSPGGPAAALADEPRPAPRGAPGLGPPPRPPPAAWRSPDRKSTR